MWGRFCTRPLETEMLKREIPRQLGMRINRFRVFAAEPLRNYVSAV